MKSYAVAMPVRAMRYVILPQATRRVLPPLANQFVSTVKDSSIVSAISILGLTFEIWITVTATQRLRASAGRAAFLNEWNQ